MTDHVLHEYSTYKNQVLEVFVRYTNVLTIEDEEEIEVIQVQKLERNFLKLFGILV